MTKRNIESVIKDIFDPFILGDEISVNGLTRSPSFPEIQQLAKLILQDKSEESFQNYLAKNPHFLFRLAPSTDDTLLGMLAKPPINNFNFADFAIFSVMQGGCRV